MKLRARYLLSAVAALALVGGLGSADAAQIRIGLAQEPSSIDPHYHNLGPNNAFSAHVFDALVGMDENQRPIPGLAESWQAVDDTTWEFKLRQGVKWHDGSPFTADDVIFSFERAPEVPNSPSSFALYTRGKTVEKVDEHTVRITTAEPYPLMPNDVSTIYIISRKAAEGASTGDFNSGKAAIGTGPYRFVEWVPGDRIVVERNDDYWGEKATFDRVTIRPIRSDPSRVAALLAGDVDFIDQVPTADIDRLKKDANINVAQGVSNRIIYLHMDQFREQTPFVTGTDKNPLLDVRVRKAISKAINREAIVERVMEGVAIPAGQFLPENFFGVSKKLQAEKYDPDGAKKLLAEAGFEKGFGITLHGPNGRYINDAEIAQAIAQMLTRVGLQAKVETLPPSVFFSRASSGSPEKGPEFSFILVGWGSGTGEASSPLKSLMATYDRDAGMGASNRGRYSNPEVDALIKEALATVDDEKRGALLAEATEKAIGEDQGLIPLHYQVNTWAARGPWKYTPRTDERTVAMELHQ
ncbi:MAG: ABC transporter substrate-binding protein [Alphaproteobacteria bacterium]